MAARKGTYSLINCKEFVIISQRQQTGESTYILDYRGKLTSKDKRQAREHSQSRLQLLASAEDSSQERKTHILNYRERMYHAVVS
jgi:hypothetical protein